MALTEKQKRFVQEYLVDLNATQAAIRAGYSEKTAEQQGYQLLQKPSVQVEIQKAMKRREVRTQITQDRVLQEIACVAFASGADFAQVIGGGRIVQLVDTAELSREKRSAIAKIKETEHGIEVVAYDKISALKLLGQHLGLFDGKGGQPAPESNLLDAIVASAEEEMDTDDLPETL